RLKLNANKTTSEKWLYHPFTTFILWPLSYPVMLYQTGGANFALSLIMSALVAILLLEAINYIEHYGLARKRLASGRYEAVNMVHSWNSNHEIGRVVLYELTRHSDHHYKANKKFQNLSHFDESPQLPFGYPGSMLLAFIPPLWFSVMDPLLVKWKEKNRYAFDIDH